MIKQVQRGFTIVELIIVIVIIAILVLITSGLYQNAQIQSRDIKVRDAADKFGDALRIWIANHDNRYPVGGYGSTSPVAANGECLDGSDGYVDPKAYGSNTCTIGDVLVAAGLLTPSFFSELPQAQLSGTTGKPMLVYRCTGNKFILLFWQESPNSTDTSTMNTDYYACQVPAMPTFIAAYGTDFPMRDLWGARAGKIFEF
ncbi:MAG: prepilin-type N-terminal cleavage/methylation domain-containing protein [Candidatus Saccharimonas sp.]